MIACGPVTLFDPAVARRGELSIADAALFTVTGERERHVAVAMHGADEGEARRLLLDGPQGRIAVPPSAIAPSEQCRANGPCWVASIAPPIGTIDAVVVAIPELDHELRARLTPITVGPTLVDARLREDNAMIEVSVDDRLTRALADRGLRAPRQFHWRLSPGGCGAPSALDDPGWSDPTPPRFLVPVAFDPAPDAAVCLEVRAATPPGAAPFARDTIQPGALIDRLEHVYAPPVETAPMVWVLLTDLQLPSEEACARARDRLGNALASAAAAISGGLGSTIEALALDPIELAHAEGRPCQQAAQRRLDADALLDALDAAIDARFGAGSRARPIVAYATNLDAPLPEGLSFDLSSLARGTPAGRPVSLFAIAPQRAGVPEAIGSVPFAAATEPAFDAAVEDALSTIWPFRTLIHRDDTRVPLVGEAERDRYALFRILDSSPSVAPIGAPRLMAVAPDAAGPAYRVPLEPAVLETALDFSRPTVTVRWEGCRERCDRPPPGAEPTRSWVLDP